MNENRTILFFDGECNLCNAWVQRVLKYERSSHVYFSSLQSDFTREFFSKHGLGYNKPESMVLYSDGNFYFRSDAALKLFSFFKSPFNWLKVFRIIPLFIRDYIYNVIARNRYRWFGKKEVCVFYIELSKSRFLIQPGD